MDISFSDQKLLKVCNDERLLIRHHGKRRADLLKRRLIQLKAAPSLATLHPPYSGPARCHELTGNRKGLFSVDLDYPYRLLFKPAHNPVPRKSDGGIDWEMITAITIVGIEDTHG